MKKIWDIRLSSIPELSGLNKKERLKLWRRYYSKGFSHWQTHIAMILCVVWSVFIFFITDYLCDEVFKIKIELKAFISSILGIGVGLYFFMVVLINMIRPYLKKAIKS